MKMHERINTFTFLKLLFLQALKKLITDFSFFKQNKQPKRYDFIQQLHDSASSLNATNILGLLRNQEMDPKFKFFITV